MKLVAGRKVSIDSASSILDLARLLATIVVAWSSACFVLDIVDEVISLGQTVADRTLLIPIDRCDWSWLISVCAKNGVLVVAFIGFKANIASPWT